MIKTELIKRSPLRVLEESIRGGLGMGNIGILASRKGVGKTACLVHIATDKLLQNKPVIHVSYASRVDYIITWYEDIFKEIAKTRELERAIDVHDEIIKNRVIMNFKQDGANTDQVLKSLEAMVQFGQFDPHTVIVDGYDFSLGAPEDLKKFREFASRVGTEVWFSASLRGEEPLFDEQGVPIVLERYLDEIAVLITLAFKEEFVRLNLIKCHECLSLGELPLKLDPQSLLIAKSELS
jgi:KaiC/GvpD/RAD55 family RecA-like ATPase